MFCYSKVVDLTYPLGRETIYWPGGEGFQLCMTCTTFSSENYFYAAGTFSCAEHGGTHVDAPFHFSENGITVDLIPVENLTGLCKVIDISDNCNNDRNYSINKDDILKYEEAYGPLSTEDIVLFRTGWYKFYEEGPKQYLGFDERIDGKYDSETSELSFPGIGESAAKYLVEKSIKAVGIDTASLDPGSCGSFVAHRIILGAGIYGIENVNGSIAELPATGSQIMVMPMKIVGGSGAPSRVVAFLPSIEKS